MSAASRQDQKTRTSDFDRPVGFLHGASPRTLEVLEVAQVLDRVAGFASTPVGAARIRQRLRAVADQMGGTTADAVAHAHERNAAMRRMIAEDSLWPAPPVPDLAEPLERLAVPGSIWTGSELRAGYVLLTSARAAGRAWTAAHDQGMDVAALSSLAQACGSHGTVEAALDRVVDDDGVVRDSASPELRKLRRQLSGAEGELMRVLERAMTRLESHHRVEDASVTMRNGRWVIPVRREGRGTVGGIVHDTSASGATVFVEPPAAVEFANRIRELQADEAREVTRVLAEATDTLRALTGPLVAASDALCEFDACAACARFAEREGCVMPVLVRPAAGFVIRNGRHPLLEGAPGRAVVPFELAMGATERTLLVSGPNTGGKTVLLKAVALQSLMAQAGVPPTVGAESRVPLFDRVFADIGDEQSIAASLSTFSGHVRHLVEITRGATADSLVLIDELGSGTDPAEGAALGAAVLETLTRRGTRTIATTHLGALKVLANEVPGVVNASLQFDDVALAPSYQLLVGLPGRSYGLSIARRLNLPDDVLANAEARVPNTERDAARLVEALERRLADVGKREAAMAEREARFADTQARLTERERAVRERERATAREQHDAARRYVLEIRRDLDALAGRARRATAGGATDAAEALAAARKRAEELLHTERDRVRALDGERDAAAEPPADEAATVAVGDFVTAAALGSKPARAGSARRCARRGRGRDQDDCPAFDRTRSAAATSARPRRSTDRGGRRAPGRRREVRGGPPGPANWRD